MKTCTAVPLMASIILLSGGVLVAQPPDSEVVLTEANPDFVAFFRAEEVVLSGDFSDVLDLTPPLTVALSVWFTQEPGFPDPLADDEGRIYFLSASEMRLLSPVRPEPGDSNVYVRAIYDDVNTVLSNPLDFFFVDTIPVITMLGDNPLRLDVNSPYVEPGATAMDDIDGDLTDDIVITGTVDEAAIGTYPVLYDVTDSMGHAAVTNTRTVYVQPTDPVAETVDETGGTVTFPGCTVEVPPETLVGATDITLIHVPPPPVVNLPEGLTEYVAATTYEVAGLDGIDESAMITLLIEYPDGGDDGYVDGTNIYEMDMVAIAIAPDTGDAVAIPGIADPVANTFTFDADGGVFALGGKLLGGVVFTMAAQTEVFHSADTDGDNYISLSELLRLVQFYNSPGYHCCETECTEDGYLPGAGDASCAPHDADYAPQDWQIGLAELLRIIQFFNSGGYSYCPEQATEDGFCPGAP